MIKTQRINNITFVKNRPTGGNTPKKVKAAPEIIKEAFPSADPIPACCMDTAKKIETEVGGAIMRGISVKNPPIMHPIAQVAAVAIIDDCSSYPTRFI